VAILDDADFLNPEGANSLLKTLEEPPPRSVLILVGTTPAKQLPTIRSRCQLVRFRPLAENVISEILLSEGIVGDASEAQRLAAQSGGSVQRAVALADKGISDLRAMLCQRLAEVPLDSVALAAELLAFVEQSGRDAPVRRERLRQAIGTAGEFFEKLMRCLCGVPVQANQELASWVEKAAVRWTGGPRAASACLDRCLEAAEQVERNANPTTLLEGWLDDLAQITMEPGAVA
jgi:DNA polymerase-3 subunit delta'